MPETGGMYYYSHLMGKGVHPAIVLLHGLGGDYLSWPVEIRRLPGFNVYTPDLPGHGNSSGPGMQSVNDYAAGILAFMDAIDIWRAIFVGHSMGGAIALELASHHPERTAGLGLISCGPRLPVPRMILDNAAGSTTYPSAVQSLLDLMRGPATPPRLAAQNEKKLLKVRPSLVFGDLIACDKFDVTGYLSSINIPTLVICGTGDKLTPPRFSTFLAAHINGAALQTIDEAGHLLPLEQPGRLAKLLSVFFNSISSVRKM